MRLFRPRRPDSTAQRCPCVDLESGQRCPGRRAASVAARRWFMRVACTVAAECDGPSAPRKGTAKLPPQVEPFPSRRKPRRAGGSPLAQARGRVRAKGQGYSGSRWCFFNAAAPAHRRSRIIHEDIDGQAEFRCPWRAEKCNGDVGPSRRRYRKKGDLVFR